MAKTSLIIATRQSPLALYQANWVKHQLESLHPDLAISLLKLTTTADKLATLSLSKIGGKGLFVKELEEALLDGRADIAVHSMKDVPMILPPGLCIPTICPREDPRDALISPHFRTLQDLPSNARVGTSSLRRQSQLLAYRPDLIIQPIRGNVHTRLALLDKPEFAALILAAAGLNRLNLNHLIQSYLSIEQCLPAAGQGAIGIECDAENAEIRTLIQPLNDLATYYCVTAERALCKKLGGNCQVPIGAYAEFHQEILLLKGVVGAVDGIQIIKAESTALPEKAEELGETVADLLLSTGANIILKSLQ